MRVTYAQNWAAYNAAQTTEKEHVQILLRGLCDGIVPAPREPGKAGRPRLPLSDAVYGCVLKVYTGMSGRRASTDIRECQEKGHVDVAPHYNSLFSYMERPELTPLLKTLVEESASPLKAIETNFAVDATGFTTSVYRRWFDHKYGREKKEACWIKAHAMVGVTTNVVTSVEVTEGHLNDSPQFAGLVERTAKRFAVRDVTADKAYLSNENLAAVANVGGVAYVPFKSNSKGEGSEHWRKLWHVYNFERDRFLRHYHQRSNSESTFSAIKRLYGGHLRSKLLPAQVNETLAKVLCFNLGTLVHSVHELGLEPVFWR
jgi:transposase